MRISEEIIAISPVISM